MGELEAMTGYLWLCEACFGNGYKYEGESILLTEMISLSAFGSIVYYKGRPPKLEKCSQCNGKGYWEP